MTEYIERGALIAFVREVRKKLPKDSKDFFTRDKMLLNFQQYLQLEKAADVEPVVRGEWIHGCTDGAGTEFCYCSACGEDALKDKGGYTEFSRYCPNCGAKMDGERKDGAK